MRSMMWLLAAMLLLWLLVTILHGINRMHNVCSDWSKDDSLHPWSVTPSITSNAVPIIVAELERLHVVKRDRHNNALKQSLVNWKGGGGH